MSLDDENGRTPTGEKLLRNPSKKPIYKRKRLEDK